MEGIEKILMKKYKYIMNECYCDDGSTLTSLQYQMCIIFLLDFC
jgi:hypothetical protein